MGTVVFGDGNIHRIGDKGKRTRLAVLQQIRDTLAENMDDISDVMQTTGLTTENITSIFHGEGANLAAIIKILVDNKDGLAGLIIDPSKSRAENLQEGRLFYAEDAYKIPGVKNNELEKCINVIKDRIPKLKLICTKIGPREITDRLSCVPVNKLGKTIDKMYSNMSEKFNVSKITPKNLDKKIMAKPAKTNEPEEPTIIVYKTSEDGAYKTMPTPNYPTASEIDSLIAKKEKLPLGSVNWLITSQTNPRDAVNEATKYHHGYKSPEEMLILRQKQEEQKPLKTFVDKEESRKVKRVEKKSPAR